MRFPWKDSQHLISLIALVAVAVGAFVLLRAAVVPAGFGLYGHYRAGAIDDNRVRTVKFAGAAECALCHDTEATAKQGGKHAGVSCEACHGPQARHAASEGKEKPAKPNVTSLCLNCHEKDAAKPVKFPQVTPAEHNAGMTCNDCHQPHQPKL